MINIISCPNKTAKEYYNEIICDKKIISLYNDIHEYALNHGSYAYHDLMHVTNVSNYCEKLMKDLNYDEEFISETKIAAILHDTGCIDGKDGHPYRSYEYAKKYFKENNIVLKHQDLILEAIKNHSNGFDTDNIIQIVLILADKLDVKKTRITYVGKNAIGNRQYQFINDIKIDIKNNNLNIYFKCDDKLDLDELNDYYFTKKIFNAIYSFSKKMNLKPNIFINNKHWRIDNMNNDIYDIIIIGAGPAGLTSALYALRANKKVLIFEAKSYGGQIINAHKIENYPGIDSISGFDFATNLYNQVKKLGGKVKYETVIHVSEDKIVTTKNGEYQAKSIIIATGAENRKLNIEKESDFVGKGISYCATCDGRLYKGKIVAVNGGGNTALEDAIYLSDIAKKVYLVHRRDEFRGEIKYSDELKEKNNVEFILNSTIEKLNGKKKIESITVKDNNGNTKDIKIDALFIAIGQAPKNEIFSNVVELNEYGYIISKDDVHTKTDGIYVAGDARVKNLKQLTTAVSDGSIAATTAMKEMK